MNPEDIRAANLKASVANFKPTVTPSTTPASYPSTTTKPIPTGPIPTNTYQQSGQPINNSINGTQQGANLVNANQSQAATMGVKIPGSTYQAPTGTDSSSSSTGTTTATDSSTQDQTIKDEQAIQDQHNADMRATNDRYQAEFDNMRNGATPLTAAEQAQVDGLKQQFQTFIDKQLVVNNAAEGTANIRGYQTGAGEYDPLFQAKTIGSIVSAGTAKVNALQVEEASAVAALTKSFKDDDLAAIKESWDLYTAAQKQTSDQIQKTISDTQTAIKEANDAARADAQLQLSQEANSRAWQQIQDTEDQNKALNARNAGIDARENKLADAQIEKTKLDNQKTQEEIRKLQIENNGSNPNAIGGVGLNSSGIPNSSQQAAFLANIAKTNPGLALQIKAAAEYRLDPSKLVTLRSDARQNFDSLVRQYDPTYDSAQYPSRASYLKNIQSGQYSLAINAANKTVNHLTSLFDTMSSLNNFNMGGPLANSAVNFVEAPFSGSLQSRMSTAQTESQGVAQEMEKFFKGTGVSDVAGIEEWQKQLSPNLTPAQQEGLKQGALQLFTGQLDTLYAQYRQNMGTNPPLGAILQPETLGKLNSLGVDITPYIQGTPMGQVQILAQTGTPEQQSAIKDMIGKGLSDEDILTVLGE